MSAESKIDFEIPRFDENSTPTIEEGLFLNYPERSYPPGLWACAGRFQNQYGMYLGDQRGVRTFIPESRLAENIVHSKSQGETGRAVANMLVDLQPDLTELRSGRQKIVRDIAGRNLPPRENS
jgi:hypothetical protein